MHIAIKSLLVVGVAYLSLAGNELENNCGHVMSETQTDDE